MKQQLNYTQKNKHLEIKLVPTTRGSQEPVSLTLVYVHINNGHR